MSELRRQFGAIDIYLFDQFLQGRIVAGMRVLDAGCGDGRKLVYPLRDGYEVFGVDQDPQCVRAVQQLFLEPLSSKRGQRPVLEVL